MKGSRKRMDRINRIHRMNRTGNFRLQDKEILDRINRKESPFLSMKLSSSCRSC
jgi:hypothetical protein